MNNTERFNLAADSLGERLSAILKKLDGNEKNTIREIRCRADSPVIAVTSDASGSATLTDFGKALPEQFVEVGIAEQNAVGVSAGLASAGKKVFIFGPACSYVARSLEQVKVDMAVAYGIIDLQGL